MYFPRKFFTFDDLNLNNWNKYPISPLITVSLDNGRKVNKNWYSNLRKSSKFDNDTHPFRLSQCTLPRYQFEKHSGNLFFFILSNTISNSLVVRQNCAIWNLVIPTGSFDRFPCFSSIKKFAQSWKSLKSYKSCHKKPSEIKILNVTK